MENTDNELTLLIHCHNLPGTECAGKTDVRLGVQKGQVVLDDVPAEGEEITFPVPLRVILRGHNGQPDFRGPFVQGRVGERFVYLCWGQRRGEAWEGFRRAKLPLSQISRPLLEKALQTGKPLHVFLDMTDDRGGPLTASIKEHAMVWRLDDTQA